MTLADTLANASLGRSDLPVETTNRPLTPAQLRALRAQPGAARRMTEIVNAGDHLLDFAQILWSELDPGVPFVRGWAIEAIAEHLMAVTRGEIKKLLINVPPGFSKSLLVNVYWPAWEWGPMNRPYERYVCTSYDQTLVVRDNIKCRNLLLSDSYQLAWGDRFKMSDTQNTKIRFGNNKTGWKAAKAITGLTGDRGSRFIFDDPQSVMGAISDAEVESIETSFAHAMPTRTQSADDPFIGIMQRLRENDITGFIMEHELGFEHLVIPMHYTENHPFKSKTSLGWVDPRSIPNDPSTSYISKTKHADGTVTEEKRSSYHVGLVAEGYLAAPERFPPSKVDDLEKTMASKEGTSAIAGQLEQRPYAEGGNLFKDEWWKTWTGALPHGTLYVRGWDFASSEKRGADWTVGVLMARLPKRAGFVVVDVERFKGTPGKVRARVSQVAKRDGKKVRISFPKDPGPGGEWVIADLVSDLMGYDVHNSREDSDKETRARPYAAQCEIGFVAIHASMDTAQAEGCAEGTYKTKVYKAEHKSFPQGSHDDQVDGSSRAFGVLAEMREPDPVAADPISCLDTTLSAESIYGNFGSDAPY